MYSFKNLMILVTIFSFLQLSKVSGNADNTEERKNLRAIFDLLFGTVGNRLESVYNVSKLANYGRLECPLCDSSVYSYCSEKLLHDACCCLNPYEHKLPYQCKYADCGFLHANSCREHKLITACCCSPKVHNGKNNSG